MFRNPCKKCIVQVNCSQECEGRRQHSEDKINYILSLFLLVIVISIPIGLTMVYL